jgi:hypothetical protein
VKFLVSKSERERTITVRWCGDPSEAEVAAIVENHKRDGVAYRLVQFEPCPLCGSTEFAQFNDETMKMDSYRDPECMRCCGDFGPYYDDGDDTVEESRRKAALRKLELEQVVKDLREAFPGTNFSLKARCEMDRERRIKASRFGLWDDIYIEWVAGPQATAVEAVVGGRGRRRLHLSRQRGE